jgi:hypothetical protein
MIQAQIESRVHRNPNRQTFIRTKPEIINKTTIEVRRKIKGMAKIIGCKMIKFFCM